MRAITIDVPADQAFAAGSAPGPLFTSPAFVVAGAYLQISAGDERCQAGEVTIYPDADGPSPQIGGELFALRRRRAQQLDDGAAVAGHYSHRVAHDPDCPG